MIMSLSQIALVLRAPYVEETLTFKSVIHISLLVVLFLHSDLDVGNLNEASDVRKWSYMSLFPATFINF